MTSIPLELKLPEDKYYRLAEVARSLRRNVPEIAEEVLLDWLEEEQNIEAGWRIMRKLGEGLGESQPPHDGADHHDAYLYGKP